MEVRLLLTKQSACTTNDYQLVLIIFGTTEQIHRRNRHFVTNGSHLEREVKEVREVIDHTHLVVRYLLR